MGTAEEGSECQNGTKLGEQDDAKPVSSTATATALNALQQVGHAQVESFCRIVECLWPGSGRGSRAPGWTSIGERLVARSVAMRRSSRPPLIKTGFTGRRKAGLVQPGDRRRATRSRTTTTGIQRRWWWGSGPMIAPLVEDRPRRTRGSNSVHCSLARLGPRCHNYKVLKGLAGFPIEMRDGVL